MTRSHEAKVDTPRQRQPSLYPNAKLNVLVGVSNPSSTNPGVTGDGGGENWFRFRFMFWCCCACGCCC